jgi:hypothetical protein
MNRIIVCTALMMVSVALSAQTENWWKVKDYTVSYMLPRHWNSDPFSSSSVCDCPGTINDNGEWFGEGYIGMVIYPVTDAERDSANRQQVWGYSFVPRSDAETMEFAGIPYTATYGNFMDMKGWPRVLQLVSADEAGPNKVNFIVYFWAEPSLFEQERETFFSIMNTFNRRKLK